MNDTATIAAHARLFADFLDSLPAGVEPPSHYELYEFLERPVVKWLMFGDEGNQRARVAALVRALGGKWDKRQQSDHFEFAQEHSAGVLLRIVVDREQVCTRRVVGTETVTKNVPVRFEEVTETVEKIEWDCQPLLAEVTS